MILFFSPDIKESLQLPVTESGHCVKVLRHKKGDIITVTDGKGNFHRARIIDDNPKGVSLEIIETEHAVKPWKGSVSMAVAPTKNMDRMEWLVEKMVEIGVDNIIPVICRHSERKEIKTDRLERIMVSAAKQSLKAFLPQLHEAVTFKKLMEFSRSIPSKFIAYCDEAIGKSYLCKSIKPFTDTIILIGPEGDFSNDEVKEAIEQGYKPVSLGECRLRTETAALSALDAFHFVHMSEEMK